jgi:hypothetical protein
MVGIFVVRSREGACTSTSQQSTRALTPNYKSEYMIGREVRCADCWRPPAFPAVRDLQSAQRSTREAYANKLLALECFGMQQIPCTHLCQHCRQVGNARPLQGRLRGCVVERAEYFDENPLISADLLMREGTIGEFERLYGTPLPIVDT